MDIKKFDIVLDNYKQPRLVIDDELKYSKDISSRINDSETLAEMIYDIFDVPHKATEYVYMLSLTSDGKIIGVFELFKGSIKASVFSPREIMMSALLSGAANIIMAHIHPSGNTEPSMEDDIVTFKLYNICKEMSLPLLDHIIVGDCFGMNYYSYAKNNRLEGKQL